LRNLVASYGKLSLNFEVNRGQTDDRVRFLARGAGYTIFLTNDEAVVALRKSQPSINRSDNFGRASRLGRSLIPEPDRGGVTGELESQSPQVVRMQLSGGSAKARVVGLNELPGSSNYFIGNDPQKWRTNVPSYAQVKYEGVYPGVDLLYYGNQRQLEYDFVVAPGADPNQIKMTFAGADGMRVDPASGDLVLKVGGDEVRFQKPIAYQPTVAAVSDRHRHSDGVSEAKVDGTFLLASNNEVGFRVTGYDPKRALVIDPVLTYSTYLGGSNFESSAGIAVDASGNAYVTGYTASIDFPTVGQVSNGGAYDAYVAKINSTGSALIYSTYLGGTNSEWGMGIAVDASGNAYVAGYTESMNFPTANPFQATKHGVMDAFVTKLNAAGSDLLHLPWWRQL
jgi:hypothetical protein